MDTFPEEYSVFNSCAQYNNVSSLYLKNIEDIDYQYLTFLMLFFIIIGTAIYSTVIIIVSIYVFTEKVYNFISGNKHIDLNKEILDKFNIISTKYANIELYKAKYEDNYKNILDKYNELSSKYCDLLIKYNKDMKDYPETRGFNEIKNENKILNDKIKNIDSLYQTNLLENHNIIEKLREELNTYKNNNTSYNLRSKNIK